MRPIRYVTGDATHPRGSGVRIIAHVCNDVGVWGAGFVRSLSKRWPHPERNYRGWYNTRKEELPLGEVQYVSVEYVSPENDIIVANMIAQRGVGGDHPLRYDALRACLSNLADEATTRGASVHMPRIGCGLAGGRWERVGPMVAETLSARGVDVTVYDLPGQWRPA